MSKKLVSVVMVAVLTMLAFAGCGTPKAKKEEVIEHNISDYLVAEKVGTLSSDDFSTTKGGLYYKDENDLYGIMSLNGIYDTGAKFGEIYELGDYFIVRTKKITKDSDISGLNSAKVIDGKGRTIVPEGYAAFYKENDRYIKVVSVTDITYSKDNAVASRNDNGVVSTSLFNSTYYKGTWRVYDIVNNRLVPGISGNTDSTLTCFGNYIKYRDENDEYKIIDENGKEVTGINKIFDDGSYSVEGKIGEVYDTEGKLLFNYDLTGFVPSNEKDGKYVASKSTDGKSKYVVMDNKGNVVSSEFDERMTIYGDIIMCGDKIYNFEGKNIIDGTFKSVKSDKLLGQYYMLGNKENYTLIDKTGKVYFEGKSEKKCVVSTEDMLASKKEGDKTFVYSYKDKDYTIEGTIFAPWIAKTNNNNSLYDLVDTMTGKKLLEGYNSYLSVAKRDSVYYIYAKYNNGADIYLIEAASQLKNVTNKKEDLYADLSSEFEKEGIKATVNKESGEIALDSSVLFGGDSAELTNEGKSFLNKFMKAYTNVAFSEKYNGFISKTMVEGHTAPVKGSTYASGLQLSEERAANVKNYCISPETGINVSNFNNKFEDVGYSNSKPVYTSDGNVDMEASRRVSFRFLVNVED